FQCPLAMVHSRTRSRHAAFPSAVAMAAGFVPRNVASQAAWLAGRLLILAIRLIGGRLLLAALTGIGAAIRERKLRRLGDYVIVFVEIDIEYPGDLADEILMVVAFGPQYVDGGDDVQSVRQPLLGIILDIVIHDPSLLAGSTHEKRQIAGTF